MELTQPLYLYLLAAGVGLGALFALIVAFESYPQGWKVAVSAGAALALGALAYYLVAGI
jgi:hypothetical protein